MEQFHDFILTKPLTPKIPDYCFTLSPLITPKSGMVRLENTIKSLIDAQEQEWATQALNRWKKDRQLLEVFYEDYVEKPEQYEVEKEALKQQYEPNIHVSIINGGIFYLSKALLI